MNEERTTEDLLAQLRDLAESGEWSKSVALLTALHPADLAEVTLGLGAAERRTLLQHLPTDVIAQVLEFLDEDGLAAVAGEVETSGIIPKVYKLTGTARMPRIAG